MTRQNYSIRLACGSHPGDIVHPDDSIDIAAFKVHTETCSLCSVYFDAVASWMAEFDPEPPQLRRHVEQEYYSQTDLATRLGVSPRTIKRWSQKGAFPGFSLWNGRRMLHRWTDVETFLQQNRTGTDRS